MSFSRISLILSQVNNISTQNYTQLPANKKNENKKNETKGYESSDMELDSLTNTPVTTPRAKEKNDKSKYYDCERMGDEEYYKEENNTKEQNLDDEDEENEEYFDPESNDEEEKKEKTNDLNDPELNPFAILKGLKIISDDVSDVYKKVYTKEEVNDQAEEEGEEENSDQEHQALLKELKSLGINFRRDAEDNLDENANVEQNQKETTSIPKTSDILFGLSILVSAGVSIPTAIFALVLLSGMPIKTAGEDIEAWWNSMSFIKKSLSILFAGSSEYVNTKLNLEFFNIFWNDLITNLKNCCTSGKSFFANSAATILAFFSASAAGALAYEGLEFSKPLASTFAALNSSLFFITRYIGVNKVINRFLNRKNSHLQQEIIDEMSHLNEPYKIKLETKLKKIVAELLRNKKPNEEQVLTKSDFEFIFKELADKLDRIKSKPENIAIFDGKTKTRTEQAKEIGANIFENSLSAFIAVLTLLTFASKTKDGFGTLSDLLTGTNGVKDLSNLLKILIGNPGGLASGMFFGIAAKDFRYLCIEAYNYLQNHPEEIKYFVREVIFNICATASMFYVGTKFPGPNNEYNIPLNDTSYWLFGVTEAIGAFFVNFVPMLKKYVERPDNKKPTLDQVMHHFKNPALNAIPGDILSNLSMFKPKEVKVEKPTNVEPIFQDAEEPEQPEPQVAVGGGYCRSV